jgi:hypothetical protein
MAELDQIGARIGVAGARPSSWSSGMQRDMGEGLAVYGLTLPRSPERPTTQKTFSPIQLDEAGSVADQDAFQEAWRTGLPGVR